MSTCQRCQSQVEADEIHEHAGQTLCDDCYMEAMSPRSGCDPWAVYTSTRLKDQNQTLTPTQEIIVGLVRDGGRAPIPELQKATGLDFEGLQREVVTLRHMELVIWERQADESFALKAFE